MGIGSGKLYWCCQNPRCTRCNRRVRNNGENCCPGNTGWGKWYEEVGTGGSCIACPPNPSPAPTSCPSDVNISAFYEYVNDGVERTFGEARQYCQDKFKSELATIDTLAALDCTSKLLDDGMSAHIGLFSEVRTNSYRSSQQHVRPFSHQFLDGTECPRLNNGIYSTACLGHDFWLHETPECGNGASQCVRLLSNGKINNDLQCDHKLPVFFCNIGDPGSKGENTDDCTITCNGMETTFTCKITKPSTTKAICTCDGILDSFKGSCEDTIIPYMSARSLIAEPVDNVNENVFNDDYYGFHVVSIFVAVLLFVFLVINACVCRWWIKRKSKNKIIV